MSQGLYGSICLEDFFEGNIGRGQDGSMWVNISQLQNAPFNISQKNGKHYCNIVLWINDEPDAFQNNASIQHGVTKEERVAGKKGKFIGNMKYMQQSQQQQAPYNANPQYGAPQYPQGQFGNVPNAGPGGFQQPGQWNQQPQQPQQNRPPAGPPPPPPGNYPAPPPGPQYGPQPGNQGYQQHPQPGPQQGPPNGPQPYTQQMIADQNKQPAPGQQFGQQPDQGNPWSPLPGTGLPF